MFTVKLYQGTHLKIVQTKMVDVYKASAKNGELFELVTDEGSFFITAPETKRVDNTVDFWDCAYVENERGATTQRITPDMVL